MTGLSLLLITAAALILVLTLRLIYQHERQQWGRWWQTDHKPPVPASACAAGPSRVLSEATGSRSDEADEVSVLGADVAERTRRRLVSNDVFRYTIRRPSVATRRTMPNLGGFSEVPLCLYDQLGNRFTVHQKVRLN